MAFVADYDIVYLEIYLNRLYGGNMSFADTFQALSDNSRREILLMLKSGRMSAGEISSHFNMTNATVSYHLSQLKKADLITEIKEKNYIYYELNISVFEEIMLWISQFGEDRNEK